MKITVITVGKKHDPNLVLAINEYEKRLKPFCKFNWHIIPNSNKETESKAILKEIQPSDAVVLLDERGRPTSSEQLAKYIELSQNNAIKRAVVIIGGAYGVTPEVGHRANAIVSLSNLVFPHQIVRLLVVEQLYRAYSILAGGNYHHE